MLRDRGRGGSVADFGEPVMMCSPGLLRGREELDCCSTRR
jgi:hypothetical protein